METLGIFSIPKSVGTLTIGELMDCGLSNSEMSQISSLGVTNSDNAVQCEMLSSFCGTIEWNKAWFIKLKRRE